MAFYHKSGSIPAKRHTQFRKPDGSLYSEELVSTEGFSSLYSLIYHCHPPTLVKAIGEPWSVEPKVALEKNMQHRSFLTFKTKPEEDYLKSRKTLLMNSDVQMGSAAPTKGFSYSKPFMGTFLSNMATT
jgi:homogentisate 1,2-dioxygenase